MQYRRARQKNGTYFFTLVTHNRRKFLCNPDNIKLLREAFREVMARYPFTINAHVILPDHLHFMWTLPNGDDDFSTRWRLIKSFFTRNCAPQYKNPPSKSRQTKKEQAVWQRRFWEHEIRDNRNYAGHMDYIHYNPVKHGLARAARKWELSSFSRCVQAGLYEADWGIGEGKGIKFAKEICHE